VAEDLGQAGSIPVRLRHDVDVAALISVVVLLGLAYPILRAFQPGTPEAARIRRLRRYFLVGLTVYPVCGGIGSIMGYNEGSGFTRWTRVEHGFMASWPATSVSPLSCTLRS